MSLFFRREADLSAFGAYNPPPNSAWSSMSKDQAMRASAMWAAIRLRADLISTLPCDVYRKVGGRSVEMAKPPVMINPASGMLWHEWMEATQRQIDAAGNAFGQIVAWDAAGRPSQIELSDASEWSVRVVNGTVEYRRQGVLLDRAEVWHERANIVPGVPVGLSPVAAAAKALHHNISAQEFAVAWFSSGAGTSGTLRNKSRTISQEAAQIMKSRFRAATENRDLFVTGNDWEYLPAQAIASDARFLDAMKATSVDLARYFGVPADAIDAEVGSKSITYANITERNLQLLTMHLGPAIYRREQTLSARLVAKPRFVKFNTDALLRMDARSKVELIAASIDARIMTPDEGRALLDRDGLSPDDYAQFAALFGVPRQQTPQMGATT